MSVCHNCNANNPDGIAYCPYCGVAQSQKPAWQSEPVTVTQPTPVPPQAPPVDSWEPIPDPKPEQVAPIAWQTPTPGAEPAAPTGGQPTTPDPVQPVSTGWQTPGVTVKPAPENPVWVQPVAVQDPSAAPSQPSRGGRLLSIFAMVSGLASIVSCWGGTSGIALGIAALVLRAIARKKGSGMKGMLITALITGIVGIVLGAIMMLLSSFLTDLITEFFEYGTSDFYI